MNGEDRPGAGAAPRISAARLYLCTDARERQGDLPEFLDAALAGGVDIVQLRQKGLEARRELALLEVFAQACDRHGRLLAVNDRADVAFAAGAPILHLGQDDLPPAVASAIVGPDVAIGRSTHASTEVDAALADPLTGYFCVGPCWPTPTKPGRPAPGLGLVEYAARVAPPIAPIDKGDAVGANASDAATASAAAPPWFAIGGIDLTTLDAVLKAGARRVVVVRAITEAEDPGAAAAALAKRLRGVA